MNSQRTPRKRQDILSPRLAAYSATAVAALAAAPHANAAITNITSFTITSGVNNGSIPSVSWPGYVGANSIAFSFGPGFHAGLSGSGKTAGSGTHVGLANFVNGTNVKAAADSQGNVLRLNLGDVIAGRNFGAGGRLAYNTGANGAGYYQFGNFQPTHAAGQAPGATQKGYLGFEAKENGQTYYGWLRVQVTNDSSIGLPVEVSLIASGSNADVFGAYGLASDNITAGKIAAVPEPSDVALCGLGLLALGAVGVREMRRRKAAQPQLC